MHLIVLVTYWPSRPKLKVTVRSVADLVVVRGGRQPHIRIIAPAWTPPGCSAAQVKQGSWGRAALSVEPVGEIMHRSPYRPPGGRAVRAMAPGHAPAGSGVDTGRPGGDG